MHKVHKPYKCPSCNKCFERKFDMNKHIESVHEGKIGCLICDSKFTNKRNLQYQDEYVHESKKQRKETIPLESTVHEGKKPIQSIDEIHEGENEKCHKCSLCIGSFNDEEDLKKHYAAVHERPKKCDTCGKEFTVIGNLNKHIAKMHVGQKANDEKIHQCSLCNASFKYKNNLKEHFAAHDRQRE